MACCQNQCSGLFCLTSEAEIAFGKPRYRAVLQPDGTYTIPGIEIFRACSRKNPQTGKVDDFGRDWIEKAMQSFQARSRNDYYPPVHLDHHDDESSSKPKVLVGHLDNLSTFDDQDGVATVRADIVGIPKEVMMAEIASKRRPFRSVEINNPDNPEFSSLALLSSVTPFHKFPLTHVLLEDGSAVGAKFYADHTRVCFAEPDKARIAVVQHFSGKQYCAEDDYDDQGDPSGIGEQTGLGEMAPDEMDQIPMSPDEYAGTDLSQLDQGEQGELNSEGVTLGQLTNALTAIGQTMTQMSAKLDALTGTTQPPQGTIPPTIASEPKEKAIHFSADKTKGEAARIEALESTVAKLAESLATAQANLKDSVKFQESTAERVDALLYERNLNVISSAVFAEIDAQKQKFAELGIGDETISSTEEIAVMAVKPDVEKAAATGAKEEDVAKVRQAIVTCFKEKAEQSVKFREKSSGSNGNGHKPPPAGKVPPPNVNGNGGAIKFAETDADAKKALDRLKLPANKTQKFAEVAQRAAVQFDGDESLHSFSRENFIFTELRAAAAKEKG